MATRIYADLDLDFTAHPLTGDVVKKYDTEAVKRSVRNLVLMNTGDKPFHPEYGSDVRKMLFEPITLTTAISIEARVKHMIEQFEPRADLINIQVIPDEINNGYEVVIEFSTINVLEPVTTSIILQRIR